MLSAVSRVTGALEDKDSIPGRIIHLIVTTASRPAR
jgi:hypothetical protein